MLPMTEPLHPISSTRAFGSWELKKFSATTMKQTKTMQSCWLILHFTRHKLNESVFVSFTGFHGSVNINVNVKLIIYINTLEYFCFIWVYSSSQDIYGIPSKSVTLEIETQRSTRKVINLLQSDLKNSYKFPSKKRLSDALAEIHTLAD